MPNTSNIALNIPDTGSLPGSWGTTAVNANMTVVDGILGGVQAVSLTGSTVTTLSIATGVIGTGSITPGSGPTQSANSVIQFTGTLAANCVVTFPRPGHWIVKNSCTVSTFYVQMRATGTGNVIGIPPGAPIIVYNDGTNCDFVNLGETGTYKKFAVSSVPAWMTACTVLPYIPCNSTATYLASTYPTLASMLGSTFGGNGITTFAAPDKSNRVGVSVGSLLTSGNCGFDGSTLGASGGTTAVQAHTHTATVTDPQHSHSLLSLWTNNSAAGSPGAENAFGGGTIYHQTTSGTASTGISVANATFGGGAAGNVQPTIIDGIEFIKT